jgi:hypothetical protein
MTMHLVGPYLSTTGKKRGKKKWASAEQKRQAESLQQSWDKLTTKWGATSSKKEPPKVVKLPTERPVHVRDTGPRPASLNTWNVGAVSSKPNQQYTGSNILGIGTLHKSNAVPIFSNQEAEDIAKMRR